MTSPPFLSEIPFGAFLQYGKKGATAEERQSKDILLKIKGDRVSHHPPMTMTELVVTVLRRRFDPSPLAHILTASATLVPMPPHAPLLPRAVWGPRTICEQLVRHGFGRDWRPLVERIATIEKSAFIQNPADRPSPRRHYDTMRAVPSTLVPDMFVLVDDMITKGATVAGAAARLRERYPHVPIKAFALARYMSQFTKLDDPCIGVITVVEDGSKATRRDADQALGDLF